MSENKSTGLIYPGYSIVKLNEHYGIINDKGEEILKPEYDELRYHGGNIVICKKDNVCGSFNFVSGKMELNMKYENLIVISNDANSSDILYASKKANRESYENDTYSIINSQGSELLYSWDYPENKNRSLSYLKHLPVYYSLNRILCGNDDDKFGFFDAENLFMVIPFKYSQILCRDDGYFDICKNNKWGILELRTCKEIISCKYDNQIPPLTHQNNANGINAQRFEPIKGKRICIIEEDGYYGCIDDSYNEIIPTIYHHIMFEKRNRYIFCGFGGFHDDITGNPFSYSVSCAKWGCFDHTGRCVVPVKFDNIEIIEGYISAGIGYWLHHDGLFNIFEGNWILYSSEGEIIVQDYNEIEEITEDIIKVHRGVKYELVKDEYYEKYRCISYRKIDGYFSIYNKEGVLLEDKITINNNCYSPQVDYDRENDDLDRDTWDALTDGQYGDYPEDGYDMDGLLTSMGRG